MKSWFPCLICLMLALTPLCVHAEEQTGDLTQAPCSIVYFQDGSRVLLPDSIAHDNDALTAYCSQYFPGRVYSLDPEIAAYSYDAVIDEKYAAQLCGEGSPTLSVRLVQPGIYESIVCTPQGDGLTVPSMHLLLRGFDDMQHHIASVHAPRTGEASLRDEAAGNAKTILKAQTGKIVAVLEYTGGTYTRILYDREEGWIRTDCLNFHEWAEPLGKGVLHDDGQTDGEKTITVRATASTSNAKVTAAAVGTKVNVWQKAGDWYAVEFDGWYGFVHEQYLQIEAE